MATNSSFATFLRIIGLRPFFIRYHRGRLQAALQLMRKHGSDSQMPVWCSDRFRHHQGRLLALSHLVEKRFTLKQQTISDRYASQAFRDRARSRFPNGDWSYAASRTEVIVTAPVSEMPEWESFIQDFDKQASPGDSHSEE